jgi:hypothetical protein
MSRMNSELLLVGSVPLATAEAVFTKCAGSIGDYLTTLPDGEIGDRIVWRNFLCMHTYDNHPQLETLSRPGGERSGKAFLVLRYQNAQGDAPVYVKRWLFKVRDGVNRVRFDRLSYAAEAVKSYETFNRLRGQGVIPEGVRFQVCLPLTESGTCHYFERPEDYVIVRPAYEDAMRREVERLLEVVPAEDLAIQWDVCWEVLAVDMAEKAANWSAPGNAFDRYVDSLRNLAPHVPEEVWIGYHFCYGDLGHEHFIQPKDLAVCVRMANAAVAESGRTVDFVHFPVPRDRADDAYFEPLRHLDVGDTRIYIGLIHYSDGVDGLRKRLETCRRHLDDFGLATECGFGRRNPETLDDLLDIHRHAARALAR